MKYVFISNFLSHHQAPFSEAMLIGDEYCFIATGRLPDERRRLGYRDYAGAAIPYLLEIADDNKNEQKALALINAADVAIIGAAPFSYVEQRIGQGKLTFCYSERLFKRLATVASVTLKGILFQRYVLPGRKPNVHLLSASAYLPDEMRPFGAFRNRAYRWGYFPRTQTEPLQQIMQAKGHDRLQILWVGRLIAYKRPRYALYLARKLRERGYQFRLTIIGSGTLEPLLRAGIKAAQLEECVEIAGAMPPEAVRAAMNQADIFLYTANRQEGWGAVLNEAMNSACGVVCCRDIGSAPYLIQDGRNGMLFGHRNKGQMVAKVRELIDDPLLCRHLGEQAYWTITTTWNAEEAARRFKILCRSLMDKGDGDLFADGPCSRATGMRRTLSQRVPDAHRP